MQRNYVSQIVFANPDCDDTGEYFIVAQMEDTLYGIRMIAGQPADAIPSMRITDVVEAREDDVLALAFAEQLKKFMVGDKDVTLRVNAHGALIERTIERRKQVQAQAMETLHERTRRQMREQMRPCAPPRPTTIGIDIGKDGITVSGINRDDRLDAQAYAVGSLAVNVDTDDGYIGRLVNLRVDPASFGDDGKYIVVGNTKDTLLCVRVFKDYVPSTVTPFRHGKYTVTEVIRDHNAVPSIVTKFEKSLEEFSGTWDRDVRRGVIVNISLVWQAINLRKRAAGYSGRQIAAEPRNELRRDRVR